MRALVLGRLRTGFPREANGDWRDPRVRAAYAIAPAVLAAVDLESAPALESPMRIAVGDRDRVAPIATSSGPFAKAFGVPMLVLPGVDHYSFLGECGWAGRLLLGELCAEAADAPRRETLARVSADAVRFFDEVLRN